MIDRTNLYRIAPFAAYVFFMILEDLLLKFGWQADELRLLYAVKITVVAALLWAMRSAYSELRWPSGAGLRIWGAGLVAGIVVFIAWINLTADWMVMGEAVGFDPRDNAEIDWFLVTVRIIGAALVVPVMEELFWRSFLMRWIEHPNFLSVNPAQVRIKAFGIVAALFALAHSLWLAGLFAGIVYGLLYTRSRTLWLPILAHAVTNGILGIWIVATGNWGFW